MKEKMQQRVDTLMARLDADMGFDETQKRKIKQVMKEFLTKRSQTRQKFADDKDSRRAAMQEARKRLRRNVGSNLNEKQKEIFKANRKEYGAILKG